MTFVVRHFCVFALVRCKVAGFIYSRKLLTTSYLLEKGNTRLLSAFMKVLPVCFFLLESCLHESWIPGFRAMYQCRFTVVREQGK